MRVVTSEVMRKAEKTTIEEYGIPGSVLMETAGRACADLILGRFGGDGEHRAVIVAGKGNNGGDGYVIARRLSQSGWRVKVFVIAARCEISGDAAANLDLLDKSCLSFCPDPGEIPPDSLVFRDADVIVDSIFGIGLKQDVSGAHLEAIRIINACGRPVVAVDIPSGIDASTGKILGSAVRADETVTFGFAKIGHVVYPGCEFTGRLSVVDIGLPEDVVNAAEFHEFLDMDTVAPLPIVRDRRGHKGDYGHCFILAGSPGKTGAAALAANSAVRAGSGLVTLGVPESLNAILEIKTTEAMTLPLADGGSGILGAGSADAVMRALAGKDAVAIGPGISRDPRTAALVSRVVRECTVPLVVDADGLNAIAEDVSILRKNKSPAIVLTPHPGEMSRLCGLSIRDIECGRIAVAVDFAAAYGVFLVLKGASTIIASPDGKIAINGSGNPGMASGGMGDVLTGIIVSLLGQRYPADIACRLGVFLHGHAADLVAEEKGEAGITASDVQERLPFACNSLKQYAVSQGEI
jgi:ADP-dependent NAD(P)H-hydrate dehydratase / NAD(P)H-hydrate epimerase